MSDETVSVMGFPRACNWQHGDHPPRVCGDETVCQHCSATWDTNDTPREAPCLTNRRMKRLNAREHKLSSHLDADRRTTILITTCKLCGKEEDRRRGWVQPMGPCWPKHGMRFAFMMFAALILFVILMTYVFP